MVPQLLNVTKKFDLYFRVGKSREHTCFQKKQGNMYAVPRFHPLFSEALSSS